MIPRMTQFPSSCMLPKVISWKNKKFIIDTYLCQTIEIFDTCIKEKPQTASYIRLRRALLYQRYFQASKSDFNVLRNQADWWIY